MAITLINSWKACGGWFKQYTHESTTVKTKMRFTVFLPPQSEIKSVPVSTHSLHHCLSSMGSSASFIACAGPVLPVRPDLHGREFRAEGVRTEGRGCSRNCPDRAGHQVSQQPVPYSGCFSGEAGLNVQRSSTSSPRGASIEGEEESWDFGTGAGFYLSATEPKWANNYQMYDYVTKVSE
jgi:S-formylglutathione hydrolase